MTTVDTTAMRTRANWLHPEIRQNMLALCDALDTARATIRGIRELKPHRDQNGALVVNLHELVDIVRSEAS